MKTFHPQKYVYLPASSPHPRNTEYKVSIGIELWDDYPAHVIKVQMVYNGKVEGRKSPSFPIGTDDFQRVSKAINEITTEMEANGR